ncbi:hypothetical protein LSAT2_004930 [Lamellibrachia satsuma]|nr:hypothetical protein LSAT2_004930 [Lamellibrachia satsuma]
MHVGGLASSGTYFRGQLSLVQLWSNARDLVHGIIPIYNAKSGHVNSISYTEDLAADWSWESLQPGPGVLRITPSTRGHMVCPPGEEPDVTDKCVKSSTDKLPPKATCPKEDVGVVTDKRLLKVPFTEPTFTEHDKIAKNHQTGDVFQTGISPIVYSASDAAGNRAECDFNVFLRMGQCETPDAPLAGSVQCEDVAGLFSKRCKVTCEAGKTFLWPVPKFYSCGLIGVWNTASPMLKFRFPPCGDIGTVKKHLKFGWDFDLTADFTLDNANTMKTQVRQKFKDWSLELQRLGVSEPFCNTAECLDLNIKVSEYQNNFRLTFDIDVVP